MPQMYQRGPGQAEYRVTLNPTGEAYGVTWKAEAKTKAQAFEIVEWMMEDTPQITTEWRITVSDEPLFGGEHSDTYLTVNKTGYHGRWAEEAVARS